MKKVSVIIPTYNYGRFIREAVDSVLNQTYTDQEVVVVDDGSTDGTRNVLKDYIETGKITYIYQKNSGPGAARNTGIRASEGEYICFLDADDKYLPEKLEKQAALLEDETASGCFCNGRTFEGRPMLRGFEGRGTDCYFEDVLSGLNIFPTSLMIRRTVIDKTGLMDESFWQNCEDLDFVIRAAKDREFAYAPESLYEKRAHSDNLSWRPGRIFYYFKLLEKHAPSLSKKQAAKLKKTLGSHAYSEARQDMAAGMFIKGVRDLYDSIRIDRSRIFRLPSLVVRYFRFRIKRMKKGERCPAR